jgi:hypothetical protein
VGQKTGRTPQPAVDLLFCWWSRSRFAALGQQNPESLVTREDTCGSNNKVKSRTDGEYDDDWGSFLGILLVFGRPA